MWNLVPERSPASQPGQTTWVYFSLATLDDNRYGDIAPVDPFARSLANLESVLGLFYLAIRVGRLATLEVEDRRR